MTGGKAGSPSAYLPFNGVEPAAGRAWAPPIRERFPPEAQERLPPEYESLDPLRKCEALDQAGLIHWPRKPGGKPLYKKYLSTLKGVYLSDLIADIPPIRANAKERLHYPTQKPVKLLERLISSSSNEGDFVFDPFCGCATTLVAADRLQRRWAGIDLSELAAKLVLRRIRDDRGPIFDGVHHRTDIPRRTDFGDLPNYRTHKHMLYGRQEGKCIGCLTMFDFRNMTIDHIIPRSKGGQDNIENLQLLCAACNSTKGTRTQEEFIAKLKQEKIRQ